MSSALSSVSSITSSPMSVSGKSAYLTFEELWRDVYVKQLDFEKVETKFVSFSLLCSFLSLSLLLSLSLPSSLSFIKLSSYVFFSSTFLSSPLLFSEYKHC
jgi:hypothetical protein